MECVQGAFKNGFPTEAVSFSGDFSAAVNGCWTNGDELFADELLDFSNDVVCEAEEQQPLDEAEGGETQQQKAASPVSVEHQSAAEDSTTTGDDQFGSILTDPVEEGLESLEWLSRFADDESFPEFSLPAGKLPPNLSAVGAQSRPATPVQTKARTKRARSGVRVWPILSPSRADSSATSSSSSSNLPTTTFFPVRFEPFSQKRKRATDAASQQPRKCSHCGVTKTPQWRAGPLGLKTLCNACGVRFKSGRLLPEYRPACSPTFSSELHSNNHRKVLEMRSMKKEGDETGATVFAEPDPKI